MSGSHSFEGVCKLRASSHCERREAIFASWEIASSLRIMGQNLDRLA